MISDETAYRRYLNGEEQAADLLVERYGDALTLYINARIRDAHEAEDLMIEAFSLIFAKERHRNRQLQGVSVQNRPKSCPAAQPKAPHPLSAHGRSGL